MERDARRAGHAAPLRRLVLPLPVLLGAARRAHGRRGRGARVRDPARPPGPPGSAARRRGLGLGVRGGGAVHRRHLRRAAGGGPRRWGRGAAARHHARPRAQQAAQERGPQRLRRQGAGAVVRRAPAARPLPLAQPAGPRAPDRPAAAQRPSADGQLQDAGRRGRHFPAVLPLPADPDCRRAVARRGHLAHDRRSRLCLPGLEVIPRPDSRLPWALTLLG